MPRRLILAVLLIAMPVAALRAGVGRDAQAAPQARRIVAIGDVHGAFEAFADILQKAAVIDAGRRWTGGTTILVQTGDLFDRGDGARDGLDLLMRLEDEARRAGGRVEVLLGNHEVMNLIGEFRDVSTAQFARFADDRSENRQRRAYDDFVRVLKRRQRKDDPPPPTRDAWNQTHPIGFVEYVDALGKRGRYGRWLRSRPAIITIDGTAFMHAGLNPETTTGTLDDVNRTIARDLAMADAARAALVQAQLTTEYATLSEALEAAVFEYQRIAAALKAQTPPGEHVTREYVDLLQAFLLIDKSSLLDGQGPLWFRGFAHWDDNAGPQVTALLSRVGVTRFVTGHTPSSPGRIRARFDNRLFLIDTGMLSTYFKGGRASALELQNTGAVAIYPDMREELVRAASPK